MSVKGVFMDWGTATGLDDYLRGQSFRVRRGGTKERWRIKLRL